MSKRRAIGRLARGVAVALSLGGCRPRPRDVRVAEVAAPTRAALTVQWSRRDVTVPWSPGLVVAFDGASLAVPCDQPFQRALPEGPAEGLLAVDPRGGRVAARCHRDDAWKVYYAAGAHGFRGCSDAALSGVAVAWERVPELSAAAVAAVGCASATFDRAHRAVERHGGAAGLGAFVRAMARRDLGRREYGVDSVAPDDLFVAALARVSAGDRAAVERELVGVITGRDDAALPRALRVVDLTRPELTPAVLAGVLRRCAGDVDEGCGAALRRYARLAPEDAARWVCEERGARSDFDIGATRFAVMAQAGLRCEAWAARVEAAGCNTTVGGRTCPGGAPCTDADYRAEVAAELALRVGERYPDGGGFGHASRMLTAAARSMGLRCAGERIEFTSRR